MLADLELAGLDAGVVDAKQGVDVVHRLGANVRKLLDLGGGVLDLIVVQLESELFDARLDGVPAGQAMAGEYMSNGAPEVRW